ncbi:hypothetical protein ABT127_16150 [Streptomyces sp. NPDC001904]|uniref:hypothetical protein n=1 Tax=Streptomyces sp. NPDC001904 TaxID=3154531 RepID=UPI00331E6884
MSVAPIPTAPGPRARTWAGALLLVLALLLAPFAAPPAEAAAPLPVAAASCEGAEHHDTPEAALRLPTGHPTRLLTAPPPRPVPRAVPLGPTPAEHPARLSHRALRTVVLRC